MKQSYNQSRIKIICILSLVIFFALYPLPCLANQKLTVVTSIFPLQEFALAVGGDRVRVDLLLPPGAEPHTWEPKPSDLVTLSQADIFIYLGAGMEPWVDDLIKAIHSPGLQLIEISKGLLPLISKISETKNKREKIDPHIWLDFHYDQIIVGQIAEFFAGQDPEGRNFFYQNALKYQKKLKALDQKYQQGLKTCRHKKIFLAGHSAFGYLAKRYNLEQIPLYGISPDAEPTPKKLAEVVQKARKHDIKAIYFVSLASDRMAQVIAQEIGALVLALNPGPNLSKEQIKSEVTFLSLMEKNLLNLREGLICE